MKPTKLLLGFAAVTIVMAVSWLWRAGTAQARPPTLLQSARHARVSPPAGVLLGTPRTVRLEADLLAGINARRAENGAPPLAIDPRLVEVARERSADMVARDYFAHVTPDGLDVYQMLNARGIVSHLAGENLARNNWSDAESAAHAVAGFMGSQPHRLNMLNAEFSRTGIGVAIGPGGMKIYTVLFAGD